MAKVVRFHELGGPEVLRLEELDVGDPGPGEVRIRVEAIGLNRAEAQYRRGQYLIQPDFPSLNGYEAAGIVEAVGEGVGGIAPGDPVSVLPIFSLNEYGVYGEEAILPGNAIVRRPAGLDPVAAAALWMAYLTAWGPLCDIGRLEAGEGVLVLAASSSVGIAAIQIARSVGAVPIATTRTSLKRSALLEAGAAHVIATAEEDVVAGVMEATGGRGARIVLDPFGGPGVHALAEAMAPGGTLFLYGNLGGEALDTPFPFVPAVQKGLSLRGYLVFEILSNPDRVAAGRAFVEAGLADGWLRPTVAETFHLEEIVEAHRFLESGRQVGKIVVTVP